jgi:hypothetical protein
MRARFRLVIALASALMLVAIPSFAGPLRSHNEDDHSPNMKLLGTEELIGATDVEFTKDGYAVLTVNGNTDMAGLWIVDVSNPRKPRSVGHLPCAGSGYDVGLWRNIAIMSSDSASGNSSTDEGCNRKGTENTEGIRLVDISDRVHPREIKFVQTQCGSHTNLVVPKGKKGYVYVQSYPASTSGACPSAHGIVSVVDITKPAKASVVATPNVQPAVGCHDGSIHGNRAYMACLTEGQIWDVKNPLKPKILSHIRDVPDAIWHSSDTSNDGKIAVFGFESMGSGNLSCSGVPEGVVGGLWFYDVSDPAAPKQLGHYTQPRAASGLCTAHNFSVIPGIKSDALVSAWYSAGVTVVDFSEPNSPEELAHYVPASGTSTWDAKWYRGKAYVGDSSRGLDIYSIKDLE